LLVKWRHEKRKFEDGWKLQVLEVLGESPVEEGSSDVQGGRGGGRLRGHAHTGAQGEGSGGGGGRATVLRLSSTFLPTALLPALEERGHLHRGEEWEQGRGDGGGGSPSA